MKTQTYYIYIYESGSFFENDLSFVGGFITTTKLKALLDQMKTIAQKFEPELSIEDVHAAELLHPENHPSRNQKNKLKYTKIDFSKKKRIY